MTDVSVPPIQGGPAAADSASAGVDLRGIWRAIMGTGAAKVYTLATGVVSLSLTARWLGPTGRGEIAAVTSWATMVFTVGYLSLGQVAIHRAAQAKDRAWLAPTLSALLTIGAIATVIGWIVVAVIYGASAGRAFGNLRPSIVAMGLLLLPFLIWEQYGSSLLMAVGALSVYNRAIVVGRTLGLLVLVATVLFLGWGVYGALAATVAAQCVVAGGGLRRLLDEAGRIPRVSRQVAVDLMTSGAKLHLNAIGSFLFTGTDVLMLQFYSGAHATGVFQLAVQLSNVMLVPAQAGALVLFSKVSELGPDRAWAASRKVLGWTTLLIVGGSIVAGILAPWLIRLVAGPEFSESVLPFRLLLISVVGMTFSSLMAPQWIGRGLFWQASFLTLFAGFLNFGINRWAIPRYGVLGATAASLISYLVALGANLGMAVWVDRRVSRAS